MSTKCGQDDCNQEATLEFDWNGQTVPSCQSHFEKMQIICDAMGTNKPIPRQIGSKL